MAKIKLNNNEYPIPDSTLSNLKADFVAYLRTIAGSGMKVVIGGVEYGIDSAKVADAVLKLAAALDKLEVGGETLNITDANAVLTNEDNEFGGQTAIIN